MSELRDYQAYVASRLRALSPFLQNYAMGNFHERIEVPEREDEFTELIVGLSLMIDDVREMIAEREETIARVERAEQRYRLLAETTRDVILLHDLQGRVRYVNRAGLELTGMDRDQADGVSIDQVISPALRAEMQARAAHRAAGDTGTLRYETEIVCRDGKPIPFEVDSTPIVRGGRTQSVLVVARDISERLRSQAELRQQRERFLAMLDHFPEIIYVVDPTDYRVLFVSKTLESLLGKDPVGGVCYREFQGFDAPCDFCTNEIILERREPYHWEYHNPTMGRDFAITDQIIEWPDGREVRFEVAIDVTQRKQAEQMAEQRVQELERFNRLAVGRELRMIELKRQVNALAQELGRPAPYDTRFAE